MKITQPCPSHDSYQKWFRANSSARNCGISLRKISKWKSIKLSFKLHFDRYYWPSGLLYGKYIFVKFQKLVAPQSHSWVAEPPHPQKSWLSKNICFYLYFYLFFSVYPHPHKSWLSKKNSFYLLYLFLSVFICFNLFSSVLTCTDPLQRPKNPGSRVALLPGIFLRVRKVYARMIKIIIGIKSS